MKRQVLISRPLFNNLKMMWDGGPHVFVCAGTTVIEKHYVGIPTFVNANKVMRRVEWQLNKAAEMK
jgi:hypothetical protein